MLTSELIRLEMNASSLREAEKWSGNNKRNYERHIELIRKPAANSIALFIIPVIIWLLAR